MKYIIKPRSGFSKDVKKIEKRGCDLNLLRDIIIKLANGEKLPEKNHDHALVGKNRAGVNVIFNRIGC